jgi:hypothetical protein
VESSFEVSRLRDLSAIECALLDNAEGASLVPGPGQRSITNPHHR